MKVSELGLEGVKIFEPVYFDDFRGYYTEAYSLRTLSEYGINNVFVQDNHLLSLKKGTIRGIHCQKNPKAQTKLLRCSAGATLDFAIDLRRNSPTYKKWLSEIISADNRKQILIPKGFGHACISLADNTEVQYKVDEFYYPDFDRTIAWNDPDIAIDWQADEVILSEKDKNAPLLKDSDINFIYGETL
jgi:dTDP-4-dehydrorhamnose 3,5-epimerase